MTHTSNKILTASVGIFCVLILFLALRGLPGNPTIEVLNDDQWKEDGPFELSPDRGRFALLYSVIEEDSFQFSLPIARFTTPDVAYVDGEYVSLFAPGLSFLLIPGYLVGKYFGAAQVGTYAVVAIFALLNIFLIRAIAIRLGVNTIASTIGALVFAFATPAFAYGVSLYQHHISTFLILLSIYILARWSNLWVVPAVAFLTAFSILVDYPNIFMMLPIVLFVLSRLFFWVRVKGFFSLRFAGPTTLALVTTAVPIAMLLLFNLASHGDAFKLSGSLPAVKEIDANGQPTQSITSGLLDLENQENTEQKEKEAIGFFKTRNLLNGFYTHFISPDRGMIRFTPVILLGIAGLALSYKRSSRTTSLLIGVASANLVLYSLWGDPYGGWGFGSRYLIPSYAILSLGLAVTLDYWKKNYFYLFLFLVLMGFSVWVNTLGAITSSQNPPKVEILGLEQITGQEEKYSFDRNIQFLDVEGSKSFVYQTFGENYVTARQYQNILAGLIIGMITGLLIYLGISTDKRKPN